MGNQAIMLRCLASFLSSWSIVAMMIKSILLYICCLLSSEALSRCSHRNCSKGCLHTSLSTLLPKVRIFLLPWSEASCYKRNGIRVLFEDESIQFNKDSCVVWWYNHCCIQRSSRNGVIIDKLCYRKNSEPISICMHGCGWTMTM